MFFLGGCESVDKVDVNQPLPEKLTAGELLEVTKGEWESCLADFYRDDWELMQAHVTRLAELTARWKGVMVPPDKKEAMEQAVQSLEAGVAELRKGVEEQNVNTVTDAMRNIGKRISAFEAMKSPETN